MRVLKSYPPNQEWTFKNFDVWSDFEKEILNGPLY